jgi:hypothetical protein
MQWEVASLIQVIGDDTEMDYMRQSERVKSAIYSISSNIAAIQRMVENFGTHRDTHDMRGRL